MDREGAVVTAGMGGNGGDVEAARDLPRGPRVRRLPYDAEAIDLIGETLGVGVGLAPFRLPGAAVYQVLVPGRDGRPASMLTLWPSIGRVDAVNGTATVVFTEVATVDLVVDVEVQFRRQSREYLIVARGGKLIVRS